MRVTALLNEVLTCSHSVVLVIIVSRHGFIKNVLHMYCVFIPQYLYSILFSILKQRDRNGAISDRTVVPQAQSDHHGGSPSLASFQQLTTSN